MPLSIETPDNTAIFSERRVGDGFANLGSCMPWDIALGRWLAFCFHPVRVWHRRSKRARAVIVTSYFAGAYLTVLTALALLN